MRVGSIDRSAPLQTTFVSLLNALALACLAAVLAYWTWRGMVPAPGPSTGPTPTAAAGGGRAGNLFGTVAANPTARRRARRGRAVTTAVGIRLLGVVAAADGYAGYAVLQMDGRPIVAARAGSELAPGLRLAEVHPRKVVLERLGVRESLVLPAPPAPIAPPVH